MNLLDSGILLAYTAANVMAFSLMGIDKRRARQGMRRIPEKVLLRWCACFGALGGLLGMRTFRHKTRHTKFTVSVPVMLVVQIALLAAYFGGVWA